MKIWKRFCKKNVASVEQLSAPIAPERENTTRWYGYGLEQMSFFLRSGDFGWSKPDESHKKVILTNPLDCKGKISLMGMVSAWRGTGHSEWEAILGGWFVKAVVDAIKQNADEADITDLFNRDLLASKDRVFTKEQVYDHIIKWFDIVEDTDELLRLRIHI